MYGIVLGQQVLNGFFFPPWEKHVGWEMCTTDDVIAPKLPPVIASCFLILLRTRFFLSREVIACGAVGRSSGELSSCLYFPPLCPKRDAQGASKSDQVRAGHTCWAGLPWLWPGVQSPVPEGHRPGRGAGEKRCVQEDVTVTAMPGWLSPHNDFLPKSNEEPSAVWKLQITGTNAAPGSDGDDTSPEVRNARSVRRTHVPKRGRRGPAREAEGPLGPGGDPWVIVLRLFVTAVTSGNRGWAGAVWALPWFREPAGSKPACSLPVRGPPTSSFRESRPLRKTPQRPGGRVRKPWVFLRRVAPPSGAPREGKF